MAVGLSNETLDQRLLLLLLLLLMSRKQAVDVLSFPEAIPLGLT